MLGSIKLTHLPEQSYATNSVGEITKLFHPKCSKFIFHAVRWHCDDIKLSVPLESSPSSEVSEIQKKGFVTEFELKPTFCEILVQFLFESKE